MDHEQPSEMNGGGTVQHGQEQPSENRQPPCTDPAASTILFQRM